MVNFRVGGTAEAQWAQSRRWLAPAGSRTQALSGTGIVVWARKVGGTEAAWDQGQALQAAVSEQCC